MMRSNNKGTWSREEDTALLTAMEDVTKEIGHVKWCLVSKRLPSRSPKQCRERFVYNLDPKISKAPWTKEEDAFLLYSQRNLGNAWARIASCLPGRTENSTKTRYKSIMRAQKRIWKKYEDDYILEQYQIIGPQWEVIAQKLAGRTKNAIKTRYFFLTEGVNSSRSRDAPSLSSHSISEDDEADDNSNEYVGNPSQALGLSDIELAQMSANFSQKLGSEINSNQAAASQISQETIKAAIAQSPKSNKRERPEVLKKTFSGSSLTVSNKFVLETPKSMFTQKYENTVSKFNDNVDRLPKRQKLEIKEELTSSIPTIYHQSKSSIDSCFEFLQQSNLFQDNISLPIANTSNDRALADFIDVFDYNNNNLGVTQSSNHDDGFGISLTEIEPITWNITF